ncbi:hypothetical protein V2A60_000003 [Cordyceps javanica]
MSQSDTELYPRFTGLKDYNPGLQTWISIGGWSMNDANQPTASTFSDLAGSSSAQSAFFESLLSFLETYGFDGVDIDWEYPVAKERSGRPSDFANYVSFLKDLRSALGGSGHNYGLTLTLPSSYWYMQHFDIQQLEKTVDWFNVMTYDLHGTWDSTDRFIGPVVNAHTNLTEIDLTMDLFWRNNIKPSKIVMGLGFYGRSFTLTDPSCTAPGCPFSGGGKPGKCSNSAGTLMYSEIKEILDGGATPTLDKAAAVKQLVWDTDQWVSYDDDETFRMKMDYANGKCLGGTMVWAVSTDSSIGTAAEWEGAAPFCGRHGRVGEHYGCDESDRYEETYDSLGAGGESVCFSGYKSFCCTKPSPFQNCEWATKDHPWLHPFTCSTGCPAGKQIVAQDPTKAGLCSVGSAFYCCDSPVDEDSDSNADLNFCPGKDSAYFLSIQDTSTNNYDEDGNPADIIELYVYEDEIFTVPNNASPDSKKRELSIIEEILVIRRERRWDHHSNATNPGLKEICDAANSCFKIVEPELPEVQRLLRQIYESWESIGVERAIPDGDDEFALTLTARGRVRQVRFKDRKRNKVVTWRASTYYQVAALAGRGLKFFANGGAKKTAQTALCLVNAASFGARQLGRAYVSEHVTELQVPAMFAQSMLDFKYPDQSSITGVPSSYDWLTVFGDTGYMKMSWKDLGISQPQGLHGDTPLEALYNALGSKGSNADTKNLLICDARTNSVKASAWALHTNIISDERWRNASPGERLDFLNSIDQSLIPAQAALEYAYKAQQKIFAAMDTSPKIKGPGVSLQSLHKTWYERYFEAFNDNIQAFYQAKLEQELAAWQQVPQPYALYTALQRNKVKQMLCYTVVMCAANAHSRLDRRCSIKPQLHLCPSSQFGRRCVADAEVHHTAHRNRVLPPPSLQNVPLVTVVADFVPTPTYSIRSSSYKSGPESECRSSQHSSTSSSQRRKCPTGIYAYGQHIVNTHGSTHCERVFLISHPPATRSPPQSFHEPHTVLTSPSACLSIPYRNAKRTCVAEERPGIHHQADRAVSACLCLSLVNRQPR